MCQRHHDAGQEHGSLGEKKSKAEFPRSCEGSLVSPVTHRVQLGARGGGQKAAAPWQGLKQMGLGWVVSRWNIWSLFLKTGTTECRDAGMVVGLWGG